MKISQLSKPKNITLLFILITTLSVFIRFWNFENLINFHGDPPFFLMEVKDMLESGRLRLVGPIVKSQILLGRGFFTGPFLYYFLAVLALLTNWNIFLITAVFGILWIVAFVIAFFWLRRKFGVLPAIITYSLLSFFPFFLPYSRSIWNPHFIPLFGIISLWLLDKARNRQIYYFLSGLAFGLGLNAHFSAALWIPVYLFIAIVEAKKKNFKWYSWFIFILGTVLGELPYIVFELRHNFYNISTLIFQLRYGLMAQTSRFGSLYYYLYPLVPIATLAIGYLFYKLLEAKKFMLVLSSSLIFSLTFLIIDLGAFGQKPVYPGGLSVARQLRIVDLIINDREERFEVAETVSADTQATEIRWWLRNEGISVMEVDEYDSAPILYLIASKDRPPESEEVWEVRSLRPFKIEYRQDMGDRTFFYKLSKVGNLD